MKKNQEIEQKEMDSTIKKMVDAIKKQNPKISQTDLNNRIRIIEAEMKRRDEEARKIQNEIKKQENLLLNEEQDNINKTLEKPISINNIEIDDMEGL